MRLKCDDSGSRPVKASMLGGTMSYEIATVIRTSIPHRLTLGCFLLAMLLLCSQVTAEGFSEDPLIPNDTSENACDKHTSSGPYVPSATGNRFKPASGTGNQSTDKIANGLLVEVKQPLSGSGSDRLNQIETAIEAIKTAASKACLSFGTTFCDQKDSACSSNGVNQGCDPKDWGQEGNPPLQNKDGSPWTEASPSGDTLTLTGLVYCEGGFTCGCGPQS